MKSVITKLEENRELSSLGTTRYNLEVRGQVIPGVIVEKHTDEQNNVTVRVQTPLVDGKWLLSPSAMLAVADRLIPGAHAYAGNAGHPKVRYRLYS